MRRSAEKQKPLKKNTETLDLKNTMTELKILIESFNITLDQAEERIRKRRHDSDVI